MNIIEQKMRRIFLLEGDSDISINDFLNTHQADILRISPDFNIEKNVLFKEDKKEYRITVPRNSRAELSEILKNYFITRGASSLKKILSSDRSTIIGYATPTIRIVFKPSANKGDVSEGLLGAAITARFINPTKQQLDYNSIDAVLDEVAKSYVSKAKSVSGKWNAPEGNPDEIHFKISMPFISMHALLFNRQPIRHLYDAVLAYANSKDKVKLIQNICTSPDGIYKNDKADVVNISSMGTENQRGTKIDVSVRIKTADGKIIDLKNLGNISLKALGTKQLYQYGGDKIEKLSEFFFNVFGITLPDEIQNRYRENPEKLSKLHNVESILRYVHGRIVAKLSGKQEADEFVINLANGIRKGALAGAESENITVVQLNRRDFKELDFNTIHDKLKDHTISVKYDDTKKNPRIRIFANKAGEEPKPLIVIRVRTDGQKTRIYLERESYLDELVSLSQHPVEQPTVVPPVDNKDVVDINQ